MSSGVNVANVACATLTYAEEEAATAMLDDPRLYDVIGARLRDARERKRPRVTQEDLARSIGLERSSISNIESGKQRAPLHIIYRICELLGVDIAEVFPRLNEVAVEEEAEQKQSLVQLGSETIRLPEQVANIVRRLR